MAFRDRVVLVTGAGRGIGRSVALQYARLGAKVAAADRNEADAQKTAALIRENGGDALPLGMDVRNTEEIRQGVEQTVRTYGGIDVLINNAGVSVWKDPFELTPEEWDDVLAVNLRGVFFCAREAARFMKERGGGAIVNIASTRAHMSEPHSEAYAASKGGVLALTHALAVSFAPFRIRVNAVTPGWIETGDYTELRSVDHEQHPAGRVGRPDDVARACLFLTAPDNDFVTGAELVVDGGMTRKMIYVP